MGLDSFPEQVNLRDGSKVTLTPLQPADSGAVLAFYRCLSEEDRQFLRDDVTSDHWAACFLRRAESGESISLVARAGNQVVGEASLHRTLHGWTRHVGELRVAVAAGSRRQGLGTLLASSLVKIATELGIEKIIVQVVDHQVAARRTFEKLGFHKEAVLPHHVMDLAGAKGDLLILANDVSRIWAAMEVMNQAQQPPPGQ
jgi:L-amino acid N-acyltransferase YncA